MKSEDDGLVILGGAEVNLDLLTETYTDIPDQVEVLLPISGGEVYKLLFKPLPRRSELDASARDAQRFYQTLSKQAGNKSHPWASFWPQTFQEYLDASILAELSIEPKLPIETTLKWMRNPSMVRAIMEQIETASKTVATRWLATLTEEKKSD